VIEGRSFTLPLRGIVQDDSEVLMDNKRDGVYGHKRHLACFDYYNTVILRPTKEAEGPASFATNK
jgi:hypothetical protein